jgi:hypothetical protein
MAEYRLSMAAGWCCRGRSACGLARSTVSAALRTKIRENRDQPGFNRRLAFVRGDRFHQGHQLTLYGLILDPAVGPQQSQAERAVEKQQAFDLPRLAVAVVKECDGNIECSGDLLETGGTDAVDALLIFLNLLKADAKLVAEFRLGDVLLDAPQPNSLAQFNVGFAGTALLHFFCR